MAPSTPREGTESVREGRTLASLQVLRGVAAILVVAFHVTWYSGEPRWLDDALLFGSTGTDFFFVLSGFILVWAHWRDGGDPAQCGRFLRARFVRIYPVYWVVLALTLAYTAARPGFHATELGPGPLVRGALLVGQTSEPVVHVAWTLSFEIVFYLFFTLFFLGGGRALALAGVAWCAALLAAGRRGELTHPILLSPMGLEFLLGCALAGLAIRWNPRPKWPWVAFAVALVVVVAGAHRLEIVDRYATVRNLALPYGLLILASATWELGARPRVPAFLVLLGEASYAIYLTHFPVMFECLGVLYRRPWIEETLGPTLTRSLVLVVAVGAGVAFHRLVERPLLARLRPAIRGRPGAALPARARVDVDECRR